MDDGAACERRFSSLGRCLMLTADRGVHSVAAMRSMQLADLSMPRKPMIDRKWKG